MLSSIFVSYNQNNVNALIKDCVPISNVVELVLGLNLKSRKLLLTNLITWDVSEKMCLFALQGIIYVTASII